MAATSSISMRSSMLGATLKAPTRTARARVAPSAAITVADSSVVVDAVRAAVTFPVLYACVSANEYVTHRYYQHAEFNTTPWMKNLWCKVTGAPSDFKIKGGRHGDHHLETLDDMSLKVSDRWLDTRHAKTLDEDPYRGTAFIYKTTFLMTLQMCGTALPMCLILGHSFPNAMGLTVGATVIHGLIWNALHPTMHGLEDVPASEGLPSSWLRWARDTPYFQYLYANHEGHHIAGPCNYNVCCPGTDHLMGTFVPESEWRSKAVLPERPTPRPQYVDGEYATNLAITVAERQFDRKETTVA